MPSPDRGEITTVDGATPVASEAVDGDFMTNPELVARLDQLAQQPVLLIASDYDGTVAPIVSDPMKALPLRETSVALRNLAALPQTEVAVISGRSLRDLAALSRLPAEIHLVGSHGTEFDIDFALDLDPDLRERRSTLLDELRVLSNAHEGMSLEKKPASVAVHYRNVDESAIAGVLTQLDEIAGRIGGLTVRHGKMVCELLLVPTDKGRALTTVRANVGAGAVLFLGDDITDEDAFATLAGPDVGVKVGPGDTSAAFRVDTPDDVAVLLAALCARRSDWLAGAGVTPIEDHSILSDQRTAAVVTPDARITWLCVPRIDSSAIFAELLGGPPAGHFSVRPAMPGGAPVQTYQDDSLVLRTSWDSMSVTDYLDCSDGRPGRISGRTDLVRVIEGTGTAIIEFAPRLDFGRFPTQLELRDGGLEVTNAHDLVVLRAPDVDWEVIDHGMHQTATAEVDLSNGPITLELRCGTASMRPDRSDEAARRASTTAFWADWAARLELPDVEPDLVRRSALTLKALCYGPTGAILAAATTSLPEFLGGVRQWDYRYCWIRDASMSAAALVRLGSINEAMDLLDWLLRVLETSEVGPERLSPLYTVNGQSLPPEATIEELSGYAGSRPVRVGNAADHQVQLDVFGAVLELIHQLGEIDAPLSAKHWRLVEDLVAAVDQRWMEPDQGIWEVRSAPRHHTNSKMMCWVTVDRAIRIAENVFGRERPEWVVLRDQIEKDILTNGWNDDVGSFTTAYDGVDLDASVLAVGLFGLVDPRDPRFRATVDAVETWLRTGDTVYRYKHEDGLPGEEGGFNLMTSWLIDAKLLIGDTDDAEQLFAAYLELAGPTGLIPEEVDPFSGRGLGNHPQAYSHLGLINNACNLADVRSR
ncbi:MAG: putative trehalose phosphatase [Acidimicrobiales bacterium]|nr:MAG: putative trehalose phosphatase [Acidimicrobiales bacterium]